MDNTNTLKKISVGVFTTVAVAFGVITAGSIPTHAAVIEEQRPIAGLPYMYSSNEFIVAHEAANPNNVGANSLDNEVGFMSNNWGLAYTTDFVGSGGRAVQLAPHGKACWGAGAAMNGRAYAQVELARTNNPETFKKDYAAYITLLRQLADEAGLPYSKIVTHEWVSYNLGGTDHNDPYNYLAQWGISRSQFHSDLLNGVKHNGGGKAAAKPQPQPNNKPAGNYNKAAGTYTTSAVQNIRAAAGLNGAVVGQYSAGQSFTYDGKVTKDGYDWLTYVSYSGNRRYVADLSSKNTATVNPNLNGNTATGWTTEYGVFHPNTTINVRSGASTGAAKVAEYHAGQAVSYDSVKVAGGYVWIHYKSYSGNDRYMAVRTAAGNQRGSLWGYIN